MDVVFHKYDKETEVVVEDDDISGGTHLLIQNNKGEDSIKIYMSIEEIEGFIKKVDKSVDGYYNYFKGIKRNK